MAMSLEDILTMFRQNSLLNPITAVGVAVTAMTSGKKDKNAGPKKVTE